MSAREKMLFKADYKRGANRVDGEHLPKLPHKRGMLVTRCDVLAEGLLEVEGRRVAFQDLRVYLEPLRSDKEGQT